MEIIWIIFEDKIALGFTGHQFKMKEWPGA